MEPAVIPTDDIQALPFETQALRAQLEAYLNHEWSDPLSGELRRIGDYQWGVYALYDYDDEPIYVGQTNEKLRTRIRRHLTNQRTDAVAMNVLDPFEVCSIEIFPLPEFEGVGGRDRAARRRLDALEYQVYFKLLRESQFQAVLNEKEPPAPETQEPIPPSYKAKVVSDRVSELRDHPDLRIARRAATLARLAQVICERKVQPGLRKVLMVQAKRLLWLAERRYAHAAGGSGPNGEAD
jgi:hypothetical protein